MRPSGGFALLVMGISLLVLGFSTRSWELISLLLPLTLYIAIASLVRPPPHTRMKVERSVEETMVMEGEQAEVTLTLEEAGGKPAHLEVEDVLPPGTTLVRGSNRHPVSLTPGGKASFRYTLRFDRRGKPRLGPVKVVQMDPLLLFREESWLQLETSVTVMPRVHEIRRRTLVPERLRVSVGDARSRLRGLGSEFHSMSEYQPGDDVRRVNWKASARTDRLQVNMYESERSGDITIILDATGEPTVAGRWAMDRGMEAVVSLSSSVLRGRHRVGLVIVGEYIDTVMPAYGRRQLHRIVEHVLAVRQGEERSLWNTVLALEGRYPLESTLIVVTPLTGRGIMECVRMLRGRGYGITIVSPSPLEMERGMLPPSPSMDLAYRMERMRRDDLISELRRHCRVHDWNTDGPLEAHLLEVRRSGTGRPWA